LSFVIFSYLSQCRRSPAVKSTAPDPMHCFKYLVRIALWMSSERRDHQGRIERVECVGDPSCVKGRDQTVSLLSNNPAFDRVIPAFHERRPLLLESLVEWGGLHDRTDDRAMLDARFHDAPIRFSQRCDRLTLSTNPWAGSLMHDVLNISQQKNNQILQIREVLLERRAAERRAGHDFTDSQIAEMAFPEKSGRAVEDLSACLLRRMPVGAFPRFGPSWARS
jgi:hypothetical protein